MDTSFKILMGFFRKSKQEKVKINPLVVYSAVILRNRGTRYSFLHQQLKAVADKGYDFQARFRAYIEGERSEGLDNFLGGLENAGFVDTNKGNFSVTHSGIRLLERKILEAYRDDPTKILRFSNDVGIDLTDILKRFLQESLPKSP